jgi:hypothetical protein
VLGLQSSPKTVSVNGMDSDFTFDQENEMLEVEVNLHLNEKFVVNLL